MEKCPNKKLWGLIICERKTIIAIIISKNKTVYSNSLALKYMFHLFSIYVFYKNNTKYTIFKVKILFSLASCFDQNINYQYRLFSGSFLNKKLKQSGEILYPFSAVGTITPHFFGVNEKTSKKQWMEVQLLFFRVSESLAWTHAFLSPIQGQNSNSITEMELSLDKWQRRYISGKH